MVTYHYVFNSEFKIFEIVLKLYGLEVIVISQ